MRTCAHTHIHTQAWSGPSPEAGFCKDLLQGSLSHSLISCFPMGGSVCRHKHGRGVLATAISPGKRRSCAEQPRFGLSGAKANSTGPAGTQLAWAWATLPRWHCQHPSPAPPTRPRPVSVLTAITFLHRSNEKREIPN